MANSELLDLTQATSNQDAAPKYNEMLAVVDAILRGSAKSATTASPPTASSATEEDVYIIPSNGTGIWTGLDGRIAISINSAWKILPALQSPSEGFHLFVQDEDGYRRWSGAAWERFGQGNVVTNITAFATGGQASATLLSAEVSIVANVATAGDSVKLPATFRAGSLVEVLNIHATNSLDVFPSSGHVIDGQASNVQVAVATGKTRRFRGISTTAWRSHLGA